MSQCSFLLTDLMETHQSRIYFWKFTTLKSERALTAWVGEYARIGVRGWCKGGCDAFEMKKLAVIVSVYYSKERLRAQFSPLPWFVKRAGCFDREDLSENVTLPKRLRYSPQLHDGLQLCLRCVHRHKQQLTRSRSPWASKVIQYLQYLSPRKTFFTFYNNIY